MYRKITAIALFLVLLFACILPAGADTEAQDANRKTDRLKAGFEAIKPDVSALRKIKESLTPAEGKLDSQLLKLVNPDFLPPGKTKSSLLKEMKKDGTASVAQSGVSGAVTGVDVYIYLKKGYGFDSLKPYVLQITGKDVKARMAVASVDVNRLSELAGFEGVEDIEAVTPPVVNAGSAVTQGDALHKASEVRAQLGVDGTGVHVGVISDGVRHLADAVATGDLPPDVTVLEDNFSGGGDEGTAMLEIVHDLAPGAKLYFHDCGENTTEFNNAVTALAAAGCDVICDDISWITQPFFEDGVVASHIKDIVAANDIVYASSAGNFAMRHYQGLYADDGSGFHNKQLAVSIPAGGTLRAVLQWNEAFGSASSDYDLYLYDSGGAKLAESIRRQPSANRNPLELFTYANTGGTDITAYLKINACNAPTARTIELYIYSSNLASNNTPGDSIFGQPAAAEVIACGAVAADTPDTIETFSSRGPVTLLSGTREKPDVCGVDGVAVTGAGGFSNPFYGTSAASPHIAAIAALLRDRFPDMNASGIRQVIRGNAQDLGGPGYDGTFGYGLGDTLAGALSSLYVTYDSQSGSSISAQLVESGHKAAKPADPTRTGYAFKGWFRESSCTTPWNFSGDTVTADTTLYAKWTPVHTVAFDSQGGSSVSAQSAETGNTISKPADPARTGYAFKGWFRESSCATPWNFSDDAVMADTTLYAKWTPIHTVAFDSRGGSSVNAQSVESGNKIPKPSDPARTGHTFSGWFRDSACTNTWDFSSDTVTVDTTLYAGWTANKYTVTFYAAGQAVTQPKAVTYGSAYGPLPTLFKSGYIFNGWFTGENGQGTQITENTVVEITADQALYACYTAVGTPYAKASSAGYNKVRVQWDAVPGAAGYDIYKSTSASKSYSKVGSTAGTSYTASSLTCGKTYYFKVRAFSMQGGSAVYGPLSAYKSAVPKPLAPSGVKASRASSTSVKISWGGVSGASGYTVYLVKSSGSIVKTLKTLSSSARSYKNTRLKKKKTYYYKVCAFKKVGSKTVKGPYSAVVRVKL